MNLKWPESKMAEFKILLLCLNFIPCFGDDFKLILSNVIFRHGQRAPIHRYPDDKVPISFWKSGLAQLTPTGQREEFELGRFLRKRYDEDDWLSKAYNVSDLHIRSTDTDRTLMSAQLVADGLYCNDKGHPLQSKAGQYIPCQSVPVHTVAQDGDYLLRYSKPICPRFRLEIEEDAKNGLTKRLMDDYAPFFRNLSKFAGMEVNISNYKHIYDAVLNEKIHNQPQPKWIEENFETLVRVRSEHMSLLVPTEETKKLKVGPFLKQIAYNMLSKIKEEKSTKIYLYSAHDTTLVPILLTLGVYDGIIPPYSSAILFELYQNRSGAAANRSLLEGYRLRMSYHNDTTESQPYDLIPDGCGGDACTLKEFVDISKRYAPTDITQECKISGQRSSTTRPLFHHSAIFFLSLVLMSL